MQLGLDPQAFLSLPVTSINGIMGRFRTAARWRQAGFPAPDTVVVGSNLNDLLQQATAEPATEPEPAAEPEAVPDGGFIVLDPDVYLADHHDPADPRDCPILFLPLPVLNEEDASQPPDCVLKLPCGHYLSYLPACQWYLGHTASCPVCRAVLPRPDNVVSTNAQRAHTEYMFSQGDATRNVPVQILDPTQVANTADQEAQQEVDAFLAAAATTPDAAEPEPEPAAAADSDPIYGVRGMATITSTRGADMYRQATFEPNHIILFCNNWSSASSAEITVARVVRVTEQRVICVGLQPRGNGRNRPGNSPPYRTGQWYRVPRQACVLFQDVDTNINAETGEEVDVAEEVRQSHTNPATGETQFKFRRWNRMGDRGPGVINDLVLAHNGGADYDVRIHFTFLSSVPLYPLTPQCYYYYLIQ